MLYSGQNLTADRKQISPYSLPHLAGNPGFRVILFGPADYRQQNWEQVFSLVGKFVYDSSPIGWVLPSADNLLRFEPAQPVGQDVGRNALAGIQKVLKSCGAAKHHVADYRQRPAVSEYTHPVPNGTLVGLVNLAPSITALEFPCK